VKELSLTLPKICAEYFTGLLMKEKKTENVCCLVITYHEFLICGLGNKHMGCVLSAASTSPIV
jgi:hypothetical protein